MSRFFSAAVSDLDPYTPGEQPRGQNYIKLNTNESPFPPSPRVVEALTEEESRGLRLYSDPTCKDLVDAIAGYYGLQSGQVLAGNGSDENLAFAFRAFCGPERGVAFADITYGFYKVWARLWGIPARVIPLREDFTLHVDDYMDLHEHIVIANPNAPTGIPIPSSDIRRLLERDSERLVMVDEAYVDFGGESCVPLLAEYGNLLVVQTMSKSRSLAGARVGFALGSKELIADLNRVKYGFNPYNINRLSILAGKAAMEDRAYFEKCTGEIRRIRRWTEGELKSLGFTVLPSVSNFLFAASNRMEGGALYRALKKRGILVRWFDAPRINPFVRITVGAQEDMETLIRTLRELLEV
ncbi:histidinol-phosphate transaminase [Oscillibacter sp. MSJ-2]|uniref:Histidinol-phosphate aminotransferase n=1 Tax=Dysosmobacter acutus TaxID=2841504 RepID=A0ABS6FB38_9FIRM|nr:histidinol-phosphate transaminase [Dysosmobacter acutus]MBU5627495.1 histidinol-phosphate transaminase [Dysosmobacter acutus]